MAAIQLPKNIKEAEQDCTYRTYLTYILYSVNYLRQENTGVLY